MRKPGVISKTEVSEIFSSEAMSQMEGLWCETKYTCGLDIHRKHVQDPNTR